MSTDVFNYMIFVVGFIQLLYILYSNFKLLEKQPKYNQQKISIYLNVLSLYNSKIHFMFCYLVFFQISFVGNLSDFLYIKIKKTAQITVIIVVIISGMSNCNFIAVPGFSGVDKYF